jgi:lysozyme
MVAIATPIYVGWEGTRTLPYQDIVGVWTVCSGDTRNVVPGKRLTEAECNQRTEAILEEYGEGVAKLSPGIENNPYEWAAHTIFAANVGLGNYGNSTVRRLYNAGQHRLACRHIRDWRKAGGQVVPGLINRRNGTNANVGEYELCLVGAIPADLR